MVKAGYTTLELQLGPLDDLVLDHRLQVNKEGAESGYPDNQVTIILRMGLGVFESFSAYHIKLYVMSAHIHVGPYQGQQLKLRRPGGQHCRMELHIEEIGGKLYRIYNLCCRADYCCWPVPVHPGFR